MDDVNEEVTKVPKSNHELPNPFGCGFCKMSFSLPMDLQMHIKFNHESQQIQASGTFGKDVKYHNQNQFETQNKNDSLTCKHCGKKFPHPSQLKRHELVHSGEKPFPCKYCKKAFNQRASAKNHENKSCLNRFKNDGPDEQKIVSNQEEEEIASIGNNKMTPDEAQNEIQDETQNKTQDETQNQMQYGLQTEIQYENIHETQWATETEYATTGEIFRKDHIQYETENQDEKEGVEQEKIYSCKHCDKTFRQKFHLVRHEMIHTGEKPFSCKYCNRAFSRKDKAKSHENISCNYRYNNEQKIVIKEKDEETASINNTNEMRNEENLQTQNKVQKLAFDPTERDEYETHIEDNNDPNSLQHRNFDFNEATDPSEKGENDTDMDDVNDGVDKVAKINHELPKPFACGFCKMSFSVPMDLQMHVNFDHPSTQIQESGIFEKADINNENESWSSSCKYCGKKFSQPNKLKKHELVHTGESAFLCKYIYCSKKFNDYRSIKRHELIHTGEKPFPCKYCKKSFNQKPMVKRHELIHTGEKPFSCQYCKRAFNQKEMAKRHENKSCSSRIKNDQKIVIKEETASIVNKDEINNIDDIQAQIYAFDSSETVGNIGEPSSNKKDVSRSVVEETVQIEMNHVNADNFQLQKLAICPPEKIQNEINTDDNNDNTAQKIDTIEKEGEGRFYDMNIVSNEEDEVSAIIDDTNIENVDDHKNHAQKMIKPEIENEEPAKVVQNYDIFENGSKVSIQDQHQNLDEMQLSSNSCKHCGKKFSHPSHLKNHELIHSGKKPFSCKYCKKAFRQKSHAKAHEITHTGEKIFNCKYCEMKFAQSRYVKMHERRNSCRNRFKNDDPKIVIKEEKEETASIDNTKEEKSCTQPPLNIEKHEAIAEMRLGQSESVKPGKMYNQNPDLQCFVKNDNFESEKDENETPMREENNDDDKVGESNNESFSNSFACGFCEESFSLPMSLQIHIDYQHPEPQTPCAPEIQKIESPVENEDDHSNPFSCKYCSKQLSNKHSARIHQMIHTGEKPYSCKYCNKAFRLNFNLLRHQTTHTGEKPYSCKYCHKKFGYQSNAKKHEKTCNKKNDNEAYETQSVIQFEATNEENQCETETEYTAKDGETKEYDDRKNEILDANVDTIVENHIAETQNQIQEEAQDKVLHQTQDKVQNETQYETVGDNEEEEGKDQYENPEKIHRSKMKKRKDFKHPKYDKDHENIQAKLREEVTPYKNSNGSKCDKITNQTFTCSVCNKTFAQRYSVTRHEIIHTKSPLERSFPCKFCNLRLIGKQVLKRHEKKYCKKNNRNSNNTDIIECYPVKSETQINTELDDQVETPTLSHKQNDTTETQNENKGHNLETEFEAERENMTKDGENQDEILREDQSETVDENMEEEDNNQDETYKEYQYETVDENMEEEDDNQDEICQNDQSETADGNMEGEDNAQDEILKEDQFETVDENMEDKDNNQDKIHNEKQGGNKGKTYPCQHCSKTFSQKFFLVQHERIHTGEKPYSCKYCIKAFTYNHHLLQHERTHTGEKPFSCMYCHKKFGQSSSTKRHEKRCCVKGYNNKLFNEENEKRFINQNPCSENIDSEWREELSKIGEVETQKQIQLELQLKKQKESKVETHTEIDANAETQSQCQSETQMEIQSEIQPETEAKAQIKPQMKTKLDVQMNNHTGENSYACKYCDKIFTLQSSAKRHEKKSCMKKLEIKQEAQNSKQHEMTSYVGVENEEFANVVDNTFENTSIMNFQDQYPNQNLVEEEMFANDEMNRSLNSCKYCGEDFSNPSNLKRHELIHTGEKPFSCKYCTKAFRQKAHVKVHEMIHTARGDNVFKCKYCEIKFTQARYVKRHEANTCKNRFKNNDSPYEETDNILYPNSLQHMNFENFNKAIDPSEKYENDTDMDDVNGGVDKVAKSDHELPKPFACGFCKMSFSAPMDLQTHVNFAHPPQIQDSAIFQKDVEYHNQNENQDENQDENQSENQDENKDENQIESKSLKKVEVQVETNVDIQVDTETNIELESPVESQVKTQKETQEASQMENQDEIFRKDHIQYETVGIKEKEDTHQDENQDKKQGGKQAKEYSCQYCDKTFRHNFHLVRHEMIHTGEKPFSCKYCNRAFSQKGTAKRHENISCSYRSNNDQNFYIKVGASINNTNEMANEKNIQAQNPVEKLSFYPAERAQNQTYSEGNNDELSKIVENHKNINKGVEEETTQVEMEINHIKGDDFQTSKSIIQPPEKAQYEINTDNGKDNGKKVAEGPSEKYENENEAEDKIVESSDQKTISKEAMEETAFIDNKNEMNNGDDFKAQNHDQKLLNEKLIPTTIQIDGKKFSCQICTKIFNSHSDLVRHERIHTGEKPFACKFCDKKFSQSYSAKSHERIHTGEKPYSCRFCNMMFNQSRNARKHERIHTGEKP